MNSFDTNVNITMGIIPPWGYREYSLDHLSGVLCAGGGVGNQSLISNGDIALKKLLAHVIQTSLCQHIFCSWFCGFTFLSYLVGSVVEIQKKALAHLVLEFWLGHSLLCNLINVILSCHHSHSNPVLLKDENMQKVGDNVYLINEGIISIDRWYILYTGLI